MEHSHYLIGEVQFVPENKSLIFNRYRSVKLTNRETLILQYLLDKPNQAITLSEILQNCLSEFPSDPGATRKIIQGLSTKLELADHIEYPYVDCYRFRCTNADEEKPPLLSLKGLKRLFGHHSTEVARVCTT